MLECTDVGKGLYTGLRRRPFSVRKPVMLRNIADFAKSPLRLVRVGLAAALMFVVGTITYYATIEDTPLPYHPAIDGWNDTILHAGAFTVLTLVALLIWPRTLKLTAALLLFGILMEFVQLVLPTREADIMDIAANASGIILGQAMFAAMRWLSSGKIDMLVNERK